ncbi:hypothetical protein Kisp01_33730 [Kineosporia sp. NBRC 101677]|uniref:condensation domain-containing protein n=1 Tax=Kineosporia sp. NBRC 101677 TaxID=3032197 RepID=UPI0024A1974E|nr:condensation domain-containing protein [Kineosporia sp. NBRC 101677]GLY16358.1 hypothetical protein Kisp01_33730 [Kineosporia sp. NBRC 101677]
MAHHVETSPDTIAVVTASEKITYRELWQRAAGFAAAVPRTPEPDPVVGIVMRRSIDLVAAELGAWLAGAAFLPLDPRLPDARILTALRGAGALGVITTDDLAGRLSGVLLLVGSGGDELRPVSEPEQSRLAYAISTSGSTGTPKNVAIEHGNLTNLIAWFVPACQVGPDERVLNATAPGFDLSVLDFWGTLAAGATLVLAPEPAVRDVEQLLDFLDAEQVTQCHLPTPIGEALLGSSRRPATLRSLRLGGDLMRIWPAPDYPAAVFNAYGPSETTVLVTLTGDLRAYQQRDLPPIGRPVAGAEIRLLDEAGHVVTDPGQVGEVWIRGPVVGRGYLISESHPAQTAFVPDDTTEGGRWYRSGDLCTWGLDGELYFRGRRDRQVKVLGNRMELGEIEHALLRCEGVRQAAVVLSGAEPQLFGYVTGECDPARVRHQLVAELPAAMIPAQLRVLSEIPLTGNGKIDRDALQALTSSAPQQPPVNAQAPSSVEQAVIQVWQSVLQTPVDRDANFFAQGGDSLTGIRVVTRLREQHGYSASLRLVLSHPVLQDFAAQLNPAPAPPTAGPVTGPAISPAETNEPIVPLSDAQRALSQLLGGPGDRTSICEIPHLIHLRGEVDLDALQYAANTVAARHEALRSTVDDQVQVVHAARRVDVPVREQPGAPLAEVAERARQEVTRRFDLRQERPFRMALYRMGEAESLLAMATHHMFFDGYSSSVLYRELAAAYSARARGQTLQLPPATPYRAYVAARAAAKSPESVQEHLDFWAGYLDGFDLSDQPCDFPRPATPSFAAGEVSFGLPAVTLARLDAFCAHHQLTRFPVLLAAVGTAMAEISGRSDLLVGVSISQRRTLADESIIGELTGTYPVRLDLRRATGFTQVCRAAADSFGQVEQHSGIHYRALHPPVPADRAFQLDFSMNKAPAEQPDFAGLVASTLSTRGKENGTHRDVRFDVFESASSLECILTYRTELYRPASIRRAADVIVERLEGLDV